MPLCRNWLLKARVVQGQYRVMAQNWTARLSRKASKLRVFRNAPRIGDFVAEDSDSRRIRIELDAIRARFPDHA
jgi:hypothetical protein